MTFNVFSKEFTKYIRYTQGKYSHDKDTIQASSNRITKDEVFVLEKLTGNRITIKAANERYVSVKSGFTITYVPYWTGTHGSSDLHPTLESLIEEMGEPDGYTERKEGHYMKADKISPDEDSIFHLVPVSGKPDHFMLMKEDGHYVTGGDTSTHTDASGSNLTSDSFLEARSKERDDAQIFELFYAIETSRQVNSILGGLVQGELRHQLEGKEFSNEESGEINDEYKATIKFVGDEITVTIHSIRIIGNHLLTNEFQIIARVEGSARVKIPGVISVTTNLKAKVTLTATIEAEVVSEVVNNIKICLIKSTVKNVSADIDEMIFANDAINAYRGKLQKLANDKFDENVDIMNIIQSSMNSIAIPTTICSALGI